MTIPAQRSFPYDGTGNDAGPYDADYFALIQQAHLGAYTRRTTAGVLLGVGNGTQESLLVEETSPQSMGVLVREGWAMVNGRSYQASEDITVAIVQNNDPSGDDRIDSIIVRIDKSTPSGTLVALQGTVAPAPVPPSLTQNTTVWEIRIADVTVTNGATVITDSDIDNSVRVYARQTLVKEGGLAPLTSVADGELPMGISDDNYGLIPAVGDLKWLIGDSAKSPKARWVSLKPAIIGGNTSVNLGTTTSGAVIPITSPAIENPDSWISSISGNQFFLTSGYYFIWALTWIQNTAAATRYTITWIHNATQNRVENQGIIAPSGANLYPSHILPTKVIQSNGTDAFELRGFSNDANTNAHAATALTPSPTNGYASVSRQIFIQKLKI